MALSHYEKYGRAHYQKNKEKCRESQRRYEATPEGRAKRQATNRRADAKRREKRKAEKRLRRLGITEAEYQALLKKQGGVCAICGRANTPNKRCGRPNTEGKSAPSQHSLAVDHDHVTGQIRGLLCHNCNLGLGNFRADSEGTRLLEKAIKYLAEVRCGKTISLSA